MRSASPTALHAARNVAARNHGRPAPLRRAFAERTEAAGPVTPLAQMLRGGRGGSVRLRLYLSFIWLAAAPPHEVRYPARAWAELLDLDDPPGGGARRIADAVRWLERHEFVEVEARSGGPNVVRLLSDTGSGAAYELPGAAYNRLRTKPRLAARHRYVQLPPDLWTSGWMAVLSPAALAMLIVLRVHAGARTDSDAELWIAPEYARDTYLLAEETRARGLRELAAARLVTIKRRKLVATDSFDFRRFRNVYQLDFDGLSKPAALPLTGPDVALTDAAQHAPPAAVIQGFSQIETALRQRLLARDLPAGRLTIARLLQLVRDQDLVPSRLRSEIADLARLRNKAAHGRASELTTEEALDYLDRIAELQDKLGDIEEPPDNHDLPVRRRGHRSGPDVPDARRPLDA